MEQPPVTPDLPRPPLPVTFLIVPYFIAGLAAALRPEFPSLTWRLAAVVALQALVLRAVKHDTREGLQNYSTGSGLGSMVFNAAALLLLSDPVRECRHETHKEPMEAMPWWKRVYWMICIQANTRGIGWNYQIEQVTPIPRHTRLQFIVSRIQRLLWYAFLADVADTYLDLNPIFSLSGPHARSLRDQGPILAPFNVVGFVAMSYCTINMTYDALALVSVALGLSEPKYWPVPFGKWRDAYTIRRFWARTWHQMMRRFVSSIGKAAARYIGAVPGTWLSSRIQLFVGFSISGLGHVPGDTMVDPQWTGSSYWFFLHQAIAITLEDAVLALGKRAGIRDGWWVRMVGYAWTFAWFTYSTPFFIDWSIKAGLGSHRVFPVSMVKAALRYVAATTGFDVLARVAEFCAAR